MALQQFTEAVGETNRLAQMCRPVIRVGGLLGGDPFSGDVGQVRNLRRTESRLFDLGGEEMEHRVHHFRMERMRRLQPAADRAPIFELLFQRFDGVERSGRDAKRRRVHGGKREPSAEQGFDFRFRQADGQHRAGRLLLYQPAAGGDQRQRVLQGTHSRQTRGHVFADAVADHRVRTDAPADPQLRQRIFDDKQRGLGDQGLRELLRSFLSLFRAGIKNRPQVSIQMVPQNFAAAVDRLAEGGLGLKQLAAHVDVLGPLAGEHKDDRRFGLVRLSRDEAFRIARVQRLRRVQDAVANEHAPVSERLSADLQCERDIGQIDFGIFFQVLGQVRRCPFERGFGFGRQGQQLPPARLAGRLEGGGFFKHDVRVGAADAKRADAGASRGAVRFPLAQPVVDVKGGVGKIGFRVGPLEMQAGRQLPVMQGKHGLDEPGDAGGGVKMADVAFHRADGAKTFARRSGAKCFGQSGDLDRVAQRRAGAVGLDV